MQDLLDRFETALADRYAIEREIGAGGMATVYLAENLKLHRKVALKVLRPELAAALGPERFLREIEITAKLVMGGTVGFLVGGAMNIFGGVANFGQETLHPCFDKNCAQIGAAIGAVPAERARFLMNGECDEPL